MRTRMAATILLPAVLVVLGLSAASRAADPHRRHLRLGHSPPGTVPVLTPPAVPPLDTAEVVVTEYAIPEPADLPHDLALTDHGQVVITGMFTHRM